MRDETPSALLLSVVLIFLDGLEFLDEAIRSIVGQRSPEPFELILVDDGSTDGSSDLARRWSCVDSDRIRYLEHPGHANLGMSASRNAGIQTARGEYVAFIDADDVWLPGSVAHRLRMAEAFPAAQAIVGGSWRWHSWTGRGTVADEVSNLPRGELRTMLQPPALFAAMYGVPGAWRVPTMCGLTVRRDALTALGGLEAEFRGMFEDQVLYTKIGLSLPAIIDDRPLALYRQHERSACEVAIREGDWSRTNTSPAEQRFLAWMVGHVQATSHQDSPEAQIAAANARHHNTAPPARAPLIRRMRWRLRSLMAGLRRRIGRRAEPAPGDVLIDRWRAQFLTSSLAGETGTVVTYRPDASDVIEMRTAAHVVVSLDSAARTNLEDLFDRVAALIAPATEVSMLIPGPGLASSTADSPATVAQVETMATGAFPGRRVFAEPFGNAATAALVHRRQPATAAVLGSLIDVHDEAHAVLIGLSIGARTPS